MNADAFSTLIVARDRSLEYADDTKHAALVIRSLEPRATTDDGVGVAGFDPDKVDDWRQLGRIAIETAGALARIVAEVAPPLLAGGIVHRCQWQPEPQGEDASELPRGYLGNGCHYDLSFGHANYALTDDGYMPCAEFYIPRNRERAWTASLAGHIERVARTDLLTLTVDIASDPT